MCGDNAVPLQAVCSGMKLGYTAEEGAGRGEEEAWLQDTEAEQETSGWRRTVPGSSNRLIDKRQALTHDQQVSGQRSLLNNLLNIKHKTLESL